MVLIIIIIAVILLLLFFGKKEEKSHTYDAKFGDASDHFSFWNQGFAVGSKALTKDTSRTHMLLVGPTGSGKSTSIIIPSIYFLAKGQSSMVINDVSGELWEHTSSFLAKKGYKVLRLDFSDSTSSETFNPLVECKTISDVQKLCLIIIENSIGETKGDVFWKQSSIMLLSLFARFLVFHQEPQYRTLQNLQRLIEKFSIQNESASVDRLIVKTKDEGLLAQYKATLSMGDRTLQSVIATVRTALHLFSDSEIAKTTSTNFIDFTQLRKEPTAIYVCNPLKDLKYFKPLSALFFQSLFNYTLSRIPKKHEREIFYVLDEFGSFKFPDVAVTISNLRKSAGMLICVQDQMSLVDQYGQAQSNQVINNCGTRIYLKGQPLSVCKELSQTLGKYTIIDEEGRERGVRELMTPDEIRMSSDAIVLIGNSAPLRINPVPYYESIWLSHLANAEPYAIEKKIINEPPLIQFD